MTEGADKEELLKFLVALYRLELSLIKDSKTEEPADLFDEIGELATLDLWKDEQ